MEEGHQKSKRPSYTAKFKHEVAQCTEEKRNSKATAIFGGSESNIQLWWKHMAVISECEVHERNSLDPRKDDFLKLMIKS
jgi:hypothetical protein